MYYEQDRRSRPRKAKRARPRRKHSLLGLLFRLIVFVLIAAVLAAGILYIIPVSWLGRGNGAAVSADSSLPGKVVNVLLLGVDVDGSGTTRSDSMIIASVGNGTLKLTSLMRDTEVSIPGWKTAKLNAAYAHGGPELAMKTINEAYGLNITRYAIVNYASFADIVDAAGGVTLKITADEAEQINKNMRWQLWREYKAGRITKAEGVRFLEQYNLEKKDYGQIRLNGQQALGYSRIRKLDSDYARTSRQRKVLSALMSRAKSLIVNPIGLIGFLTESLKSIETNMTVPEMMSLGIKGVLSGGVEQMRLPVQGTFKEGNVNGEWRQHSVDFAANRRAFIEFVY